MIIILEHGFKFIEANAPIFIVVVLSEFFLSDFWLILLFDLVEFFEVSKDSPINTVEAFWI